MVANHFESKPGLINMVQSNQFSRGAIADPNLHLANSHKTIHILGQRQCDELDSKTTLLRRNIGNFRKFDQEPMHEAYESFKDLHRNVHSTDTTIGIKWKDSTMD